LFIRILLTENLNNSEEQIGGHSIEDFQLQMVGADKRVLSEEGKQLDQVDVL